jgi:dienelactone hydrolase
MNQNSTIRQTEVTIRAEDVLLEGTLNRPDNPLGIVVFAHGSGSSRFSPRNRFVAEVLNDVNLGTLLFDLLTRREQQAEEMSGHLRFDVGLLAARLIAVIDWLGQVEAGGGVSIGLFGASTGAAAALVAAAERPNAVRTIVSRGGRPDLAGGALAAVKTPTLLIVGGNDTAVIGLNQEASRSLGGPHRLEIVPGASHLFEEPGTLETVARLARDWFQEHLPLPA